MADVGTQALASEHTKIFEQAEEANARWIEQTIAAAHPPLGGRLSSGGEEPSDGGDMHAAGLGAVVGAGAAVEAGAGAEGAGGIVYNPRFLEGTAAEYLIYALGNVPAGSKVLRDLRALVDHEMAHVLQGLARDDRGNPRSVEVANLIVRNIVQEYRLKKGEEAIRAELGDRAWDGSSLTPGEPWRETWAEAFAAYWSGAPIVRDTRRMVRLVLRRLYPGTRL